MKNTPRLYENILKQHFTQNRQMAFLSGPRQVGKTTSAKSLGGLYLNWDLPRDRKIILQNQNGLETAALNQKGTKPLLVLDEFHKNRRFKNYLKGLFDSTEKKLGILVTGSARMDFYRRGSDSLMGRYFPYRMHPLSAAELLHVQTPRKPLYKPAPLSSQNWRRLLTRGGFPEAFFASNETQVQRWRNLRYSQLIKEDIRDTTRIQELAQIEHLALLLQEHSAQQIVVHKLAQTLQVTSVTAKRWMETLAGLYHGFLLRPWYKQVSRSLKKEPKWFDRDWSNIEDKGARFETLIACHLLKAVQGWTDLGFGSFDLHYIRDKEKREVDFLVSRDNKPWFLVEAKHGKKNISPWLKHFHKKLKTHHAFQVVMDMPYSDVNCFKLKNPCAVPAVTFLSQLL